MNGRRDTVFAVLVAIYLGALVSANAIAAKMFVVFGVPITAGALAIPLVYITTDLINELGGARVTRAVVWMGLVANVVLVGMVLLGGAVPVSPLGATQAEYEAIFNLTWRVVAGSSIAYLVSSLVDVQVFAAIKKRTGQRWFWLRKNGSTVVSQAIDSALFVSIAFAGTLPARALATMAVGQYLIKIAMAPIGTPLSYLALRLAREKETA